MGGLRVRHKKGEDGISMRETDFACLWDINLQYNSKSNWSAPVFNTKPLPVWTEIRCPAGQVVTGINLTHAAGEEQSWQQGWSIRC